MRAPDRQASKMMRASRVEWMYPTYVGSSVLLIVERTGRGQDGVEEREGEEVKGRAALGGCSNMRVEHCCAVLLQSSVAGYWVQVIEIRVQIELFQLSLERSWEES